MSNFVCRICGFNGDYLTGDDGLYYCQNCTISFLNPANFSLSNVNIEYEKVDKDIKSLEKKITSDSGWDVYCAEESVSIYPGKCGLILCGIRVKLPENYELQLRPKSGLNSKLILTLLGTIDKDYRGEIKAVVYNATNYEYTFKFNDKIGQLVPMRVDNKLSFKEIDSIDVNTERSENGFGSQGR